MATDTHRESAKIYAFASRARIGGSLQGEQDRAIAELASRRVTSTEFGSGWYHEAAIEEAQRDGKRKS